MFMNRTHPPRAKQDSRRCETGKARYRDKTEAVQTLHVLRNSAARQLNDFGTTRRNESRSYKCPACKGWHLTSKPLSGISNSSFVSLVMS
jgi:hypothetical protein